MKQKKKLLITVILVCALVAAVVFLTFSTAATKMEQSAALPDLYSLEEMDYAGDGEIAQRTKDSFAATLCVGEDNTPNSAVSLQGEESGALFSLDDRSVLFSKSMYERIYPASLTKIMTAIVALKYGDMNASVTINWQDLDLEPGSQVCGFQIGDVVSMDALMHGLLIHSGNDAAMAIARSVAGSADAFVDLMNEELNELGATGSHFTNPTGLHDENHYTTVYDLYLMFNAALQYDTFTNIMQVGVYDLQYTDADGDEAHITLDSTDLYLTGTWEAPSGVTVLGGKTGTTDEAGSCLCVESQNAYGQPYVSILVGAATKDALYTDMNTLLSLVNA